MTWPTVAVVTTNIDSGSDSPASARTDLKDAVDKLNQIMAHVSTFAATVLDDTTSSAARTTLGAAASGANSDITSLGAATGVTAAAGNRSTLLATTAAAGENAPAGAVAAFAMNSAPTGWLKANGAAISRSTYATLFAAISTTFGSGDGSTTFNVPDLRGEFVRGWDDGRGVDTSRSFGTSQSHQFAAHTHTVPLTSEMAAGANSGALRTGGSTMTSSSAGGTVAPDETRPRNIALLYCIRY